MVFVISTIPTVLSKSLYFTTANLHNVLKIRCNLKCNFLITRISFSESFFFKVLIGQGVFWDFDKTAWIHFKSWARGAISYVSVFSTNILSSTFLPSAIKEFDLIKGSFLQISPTITHQSYHYSKPHYDVQGRFHLSLLLTSESWWNTGEKPLENST